MKSLLEDENRELFKATPEWISEKYDMLNNWLFGGKLGACRFGIFTTGKGSQGRTLGWFCVNGGNKQLKADKYTRRMYAIYEGGFGKEYVNSGNFVELCNPAIKLNGNYKGTEQSLLSTLVHEMCHYYTYMHGWVPKQAHGVEFRDIAAIISSRSNGQFSIQRIANAEEMQGYELDPEMQAKKQKRLENKINKITVVVVFMKNGQVRLVNAENKDLVDYIVGHHQSRGDANKILISNDPNLVKTLYDNRYKGASRTYSKCWNIKDDQNILDAVQDVGKYKITEIL